MEDADVGPGAARPTGGEQGGQTRGGAHVDELEGTGARHPHAQGAGGGGGAQGGGRDYVSQAKAAGGGGSFSVSSHPSSHDGREGSISPVR